MKTFARWAMRKHSGSISRWYLNNLILRANPADLTDYGVSSRDRLGVERAAIGLAA